MNKNKKSRSFVNKGKTIFQKFRRIFTKKKCSAFNVSSNNKKIECIEKIYVINLDRQPNRYKRVQSEFSKIMDTSRNSLTNILERVTAVDAIN